MCVGGAKGRQSTTKGAFWTDSGIGGIKAISDCAAADYAHWDRRNMIFPPEEQSAVRVRLSKS